MMIITVIQNLFSRPATRRYPFGDIREPHQHYRGKIRFDENKCKLCGACSRVCPSKAIDVNRQARQVKYFPFNCIYCSSCIDICPGNCIMQDAHYTAPNTVKTIDVYNVPAPAPTPGTTPFPNSGS